MDSFRCHLSHQILTRLAARGKRNALETALNFEYERGMGKRLSTKHRKLRRDKATAYKADKSPWDHKIAETRSKKALKKKAYPMT